MPAMPSLVPRRSDRSVALNPQACEFIPSAQGQEAALCSRNTKEVATHRSERQVGGSDGHSTGSAGRRDSFPDRKGNENLIHRDRGLRGLPSWGGAAAAAAAAVVPARQRRRKNDNSNSNSGGRSTGSMPSEPKSSNSRERARQQGPHARETMARGAVGGPAEASEAGSSRGTSRRRGGRRRTSSAGIHSTNGSDTATRSSTVEDNLRVCPQTQAAAATLAGSRQASSDRRPRKRGNQRQRRPPDERSEPLGDRTTGNPPRPPRPKRGACSNETQAVARCSNAAGRPNARAGADSDPQTGGETDAKGHAEAFRSRNSQNIDKSRDPAIARFGEARLAVSPTLPLSLQESEEEKDFPALPPTGGHRQTVGEQPPPLPPVAPTELVRLDYSSLAERLAVDGAAASLSSAVDSTEAGSFLRLSVLPGFGDSRVSKARLYGTNNTPPECSESSTRLAGDEDGVRGTLVAQRLSSVLPPPPPQPALGAHTSNKQKRVGAAAETLALRARLRERWFRLDATRKAQRQRESAERGRMATEDGDAIDGNESNSAWTRRQRLVDRSCGIDDGASAGDGRDSEEEDTSSSRDETPGQERPRSPRGSSAFTTFSPQEVAVAETPCPVRSNTALISGSRQAITSSSAARGLYVSSETLRAVSAAGVAAIRRSEAAGSVSTPTAQSRGIGDLTGLNLALPANEDAPRPNSSDKMNASVVATDLAATGPTLGCYENDNADTCLSEGGGGSDSYSGDISALPEDRVHAVCGAGMSGLLNGLLIRSGGRVADGKDKLRRTPLHLAAESGSLECVNLLLKQGTRLDQRDRLRETPLHKAARSGNSAIVKALCTARMKVNVRNRHRETPLLLAVRANNAEAVAGLLGFGARLDEPDVNGVTPVVQAAMRGQAEILMTMANSNQAWKSSNREGAVPRTMVAMADRGRKHRGNATGKRRALPSPLYHRGKSGDVPVSALSPVHEAAASGQPETLSLLLQLGVSLEERDSAAGVEGETPLGRAVKAGQLDCARLLLDAGALIGRENARGETPLVIAIRAGQASAVEFLVQHGAPVDGGGSHGRLTAADGRAPAGAREKMMARRRIEPLQLALREGQLACAAVLIESGARIHEGALRVVKLEPAGDVARDTRVMYAGTSPDANHRGSAWSGSSVVGVDAFSRSGATTLPLQADVFQAISPEISVVAESAPPDGGGLDEGSCQSFDVRAGLSGDSCRSWLGEENTETAKEYVGGLLPALGECDVVLVLDDGSRLPVHSCLLAAFSTTFCDLFLHQQGRHRKGTGCACSIDGIQSSNGILTETEPTNGNSPENGEPAVVTTTGAVHEDDCRRHSRDVHPLLVGLNSSYAAVAAAAFAATVIADNTRGRSPAAVEWGSAKGEVLVRFWGAGTMAAVVKHLYTGQPPFDSHVDGLGRLLVASVSLRIPRLMRQVEHLLSASLSRRKGNDRSAQHAEAATLLRAARVLRAKDLEERCTLYLQANGVFPEVMKIRRELKVPSLNASDVTRGLACLSGSGYLGSGPAHAWSSSGSVLATSTAAVVAGAKRAVDLSLRKRAVDFDQLVPLLLDPARCASTLSVGYPERPVLLMAALADARPGSTTETSPSQNVTREPLLTQQQRHRLSRRRYACCVGCSSGSRERRSAVPLVSNFSAFSHDMDWLLRTGAVADVILVLPEQGEGSDVVQPSVVLCDAKEDHSNDNRRNESFAVRAGTDSSVLEAQRAAGPADGANHVPSTELVDTAGRGRAIALSKTKETNESSRFLAHSMVLGSRSEKFAAMLRFVRRQDGDYLTCEDRYDTGSSSDCSNAAGVGSAEEINVWKKQRNDRPNSRSAPVDGSDQEDVAIPEQAECGGDWSPLESGYRLAPHEHRRRRLRRLPRRNPKPRELKLQSPLLSPRSLGHFLEFLYTGVLNPRLSTGELCELALIADEYLVPDLTRQAEDLLVECLAPRNGHGSSFSEIAGSQTKSSSNDSTKRDEDTASTPLEVLQLAISLDLRHLSAEAAKAVLLQLERVSRSEAFEESGMSKRELVVAALEAVRS